MVEAHEKTIKKRRRDYTMEKLQMIEDTASEDKFFKEAGREMEDEACYVHPFDDQIWAFTLQPVATRGRVKTWSCRAHVSMKCWKTSRSERKVMNPPPPPSRKGGGNGREDVHRPLLQ